MSRTLVRATTAPSCATSGVRWIAQIDRDVLATPDAQPTRLDDALTALAAAAVTI